MNGDLHLVLALKRRIGRLLGINALKQTAQQHAARLDDMERRLAATPATTRPRPQRLCAARDEVRATVAASYLQGEGIEIGALTTPLPVPSGVRVRYLEKYTVAQMKAQFGVAGLGLADFGIDEAAVVSPDLLDDAETLARVGDNAQDFVIANHVLEHLQNPVRAFANMLRVTRHGGIVYLALPDMRRCFDHRRRPTPLEHVLRDYEQGPAWSRDQAYEEFARVFVAEGMQKGLLDWCQGEAREARERETAETLKRIDFSIHFHAWTPEAMLEMFVAVKRRYALPFEFKLVLPNHDEVIFVFEKTVPVAGS